MSRTLGAVALALVVSLLAALPAGAAQKKKITGGAITWPDLTAVAAGQSVTVTVAPLKNTKKVTRVRLVKVTPAGKVIFYVDSVRKRSGGITVKVPLSAEGRHELWVERPSKPRVKRAFTITASPGGAPSTPPPVNAPRPQVELGLDRQSAAAGEGFSLTLKNIGNVALTYGAEYTFERFDGANWIAVGAPQPFPAWGASLEPGASRALTGTVPSGVQPGAHRIVKSFGTSGGASVVATVPITIT